MGVAVGLGVLLREVLLEELWLGVGPGLLDTEGLAPRLKVLAGVELTEALRLPVLEGVEAPVPVPDAVTLLVGVPVPVALAVVLGVSGTLPEEEGEAPGLRLPVGEELTELLRVTVEEGVAAGLPVPV